MIPPTIIELHQANQIKLALGVKGKLENALIQLFFFFQLLHNDKFAISVRRGEGGLT